MLANTILGLSSTTPKKVAVVTGANKGIGYSIVKGLCEKFEGDVYLTSRDPLKGEEAVRKLKKLGLNPLYHQLDILDQNSVDTFRDYVKNKHGGLDCLINNAAVNFKGNTTVPFAEQAEKSVETNFFGTLRVCKAVFALLRPNARVVNMSSSAGHLTRIPSAELRKKFSDPNLTVDGLIVLMKKFINDAKEFKYIEEGWGNQPDRTPYIVSKVGVSALTNVQQKDFDNESPNRNIAVNSVHPGWVHTGLNPVGYMITDDGARPALYAALGDHNLKGKYIWNDCSVVDWFGSVVPPSPKS